MNHRLLLCAASLLLAASIGCHHNTNKHSYLVGPPCGEACDTGCGAHCDSGCNACGGEACDACGGRGLHQCEACRGDGCGRCGGLGGHACGACGGHGGKHDGVPNARKVARRQARQDADAWSRQPMNGGPMSASVSYPYYTNRGPRDYFANPPRSIGP